MLEFLNLNQIRFQNIRRFNKSKINHLRNVLRLSEGSKLDVFDGEGNSSICKIVSLEKKR